MKPINELIQKLNTAIAINDLDAVVSQLAAFDETTINEGDDEDLQKLKRPIDVAVESGSAATVTLVCTKKPNLNIRNESTGNYPVHTVMLRASKDNKNIPELIHIFQLLFDNGAQLGLKDRDGNTLLHIAVLNTSLHAFIEPLVRMFGCDINALNKQGRTPLWCARDRFASSNPVIALIENELGGCESSNATRAFVEDFNDRRQEVYFKYAKTYRDRRRGLFGLFAQSSALPSGPGSFNDDDSGSDHEDDQSKTSVTAPVETPVTTPKTLAKRLVRVIEDPTINKMVECLNKGSTDTVFKVFFNALNRKANKAEIAESIIARCAETKIEGKEPANYEQRIALIQGLALEVLANDTDTSTATTSTSPALINNL